MVKLGTLTQLVNFINNKKPRRMFIAINKEEVVLFSDQDAIVYVEIPDPMAAFKQAENFDEYVTWRKGSKNTSFSGFLIPAVKNEEIAGSSIKVKANYDGVSISTFEDVYGTHYGIIKAQIVSWLQSQIQNIQVF